MPVTGVVTPPAHLVRSYGGLEGRRHAEGHRGPLSRQWPVSALQGQPDQYVGRILRSHENKTTAEIHDYLDERTGVLAAMLAQPRIGLHRPRASPTHASSH